MAPANPYSSSREIRFWAPSATSWARRHAKVGPSSTTSLHFIQAKLQQPCAGGTAGPGRDPACPPDDDPSLSPRPKLARHGKCYLDINLETISAVESSIPMLISLMPM